MNMRRKWIIGIPVLVGLGLVLLFTLLPYQGFNARPDQMSIRWCQCVDYVRNRFSLPPGGGFVGAADMGPFLERNGFVPLREPMVGAVIVFPRWFGSGIDATYGHVGVVTTIRSSGDAWSLTVRGARQNNQEWAEHGCSNVSDMDHITVPYGSDIVSFYVRGPAPGQLQIVEDLQLSTTAPQIGEHIQARFSVQNVGEQALVIQNLTAGGRLGQNWNDAIQADFPHVHDLTLQPGDSYSYETIQALGHEGSYFVEPVVRVDNEWRTIANSTRINYTVLPSAPLPTATVTEIPTTVPAFPDARDTQKPAPATAQPTPTPEPPNQPEPTATVPPAAPSATALPFDKHPTPPATSTVPLQEQSDVPEIAHTAPGTDAAHEPELFQTTQTTITASATPPLPALQNQWSSQEHLTPGSYTLRVWAGKGTRVYLDGELVLDGLMSSGPYRATYPHIAGGDHTITVKLYEGNDGVQAHYVWDWEGP